MKWEAFYHTLGKLDWFDLSTAQSALASPKPQTLQQLTRWVKAGRLMHLRRGMYSFSPLYQKSPLSPLLAANEMYRPSYLGGIWALGFYSLIPEKVVTYTSVTTRVTRSFTNPLGEFSYANVRRDLFRNFSRRELGGASVWISDPEKALLDTWHLHPGEWSAERMEEMRFQNFHLIGVDSLRAYAQGYPPRIRRAVAEWEKLTQKEEKP